MKGSHHESVYNEEGKKIGHLRITNDGEIYSAWIHKQFLKIEQRPPFILKLISGEEE